MFFSVLISQELPLARIDVDKAFPGLNKEDTQGILVSTNFVLAFDKTKQDTLQELAMWKLQAIYALDFQPEFKELALCLAWKTTDRPSFYQIVTQFSSSSLKEDRLIPSV